MSTVTPEVGSLEEETKNLKEVYLPPKRIDWEPPAVVVAFAYAIVVEAPAANIVEEADAEVFFQTIYGKRSPVVVRQAALNAAAVGRVAVAFATEGAHSK